MLKHQQLESKPQTNVSKIEQILAQQLANGDITPEVYLEAVSKLKLKHENVSIPLYG